MKEFNLSENEQIPDKACNYFLVKMIHDQTGEKARSYISNIESMKVDLISQKVHDWEERISELSRSHEIEIPQTVWEVI